MIPNWACSQGNSVNPNQDAPSMNIFEQNANQICKDSGVQNFFKMDEKGLFLYADSVSKIQEKPEFSLYADEFPVFRKLLKTLSSKDLYELYRSKGNSILDSNLYSKYNQRKPHQIDSLHPLRGIRIAIDPGHVAGSQKEAVMEQKFISIKDGTDTLKFYEASLAYFTAKFLAEKLQEAGAEVLLTRKKNGYTAFGKTYEQWRKTDLNKAVKEELNAKRITQKEALYLLQKASAKQVFSRFFRNYDLRERAKIINDFQPDLTIVVHYNCQEANAMSKKGMELVDDNFNMAFIPGSWGRSSVEDSLSRFHLARLLVSDEIYHSTQFSKYIVQSFTKNLGVAPLDTISAESLNYIKAYSLKTNETGVYSRNLALTKYVVGTICYGESLYQDNFNECRRLANLDLEIEGMKISSRTQEVAHAYYEGILDYLNSISKK